MLLIRFSFSPRLYSLPLRHASEDYQQLRPKTQQEQRAELQTDLSSGSEGRTSKFVTRLQFHKHKHAASQTRAG